jgi:SAM-dependent methyltransferase
VTESEHQRLSAVAHATSLMWGPIDEATLGDIVERVASLEIGPGSRVLDLGCGPAELLRRIVERTGASGVGVDASPFALDEARARIARSSVGEHIELRLADAQQIDRRPAHGLVLCIGPGWDAGGWSELTSWTAGFVARGGHLLLGQGSWRRVPSGDELRMLGMELGDYPLTDAVEAIVARAGVEVLWSHRASREDWDAYGERYRGAMLEFARSSPDDPIAAAARERSGGGWRTYDLLHSLLDFVLVLGKPDALASRS